MRDLTNGICGILCRGAGSRLHGNMKVSAHLRFFLSNFLAEYQSREHATKPESTEARCDCAVTGQNGIGDAAVRADFG